MLNVEPYTEERHLEGLKIILTKLCETCPAYELARKLYPDRRKPQSVWTNSECDICTNFISRYLEYKHPNGVECPCNQYGQAEAITKTEKVLQRHFPEVWKEILETLETPEED